MKTIREMIRSIIKDDALYRRKDLPGDLDDPEPSSCGGDCECDHCKSDEDFVTPKYALYSMIGDAIEVYDSMEDDQFDDEEINGEILRLAIAFRQMKP